MSTGLLIGIILLSILGVLLIIAKLSKSDHRERMEQVCTRLQGFAIEASLIEESITKDTIYLQKLNKKIPVCGAGSSNYHNWWAICDIQRHDVDYIFLAITNYNIIDELPYKIKYGRSVTTLHLEFMIIGELIEPTPLSDKITLGKNLKELIGQFFIIRTAKLTFKKEKGLGGKIVDIQWKGDATLSQKLDSDIELERAMLQCLSESINLRDVNIFYSKAYGWAVIRIPYFIPNAQEFAVITRIARDIKSAWFGINA